MASSAVLNIDILADAAQAQKAMKVTAESAESLGKETTSMGKAMGIGFGIGAGAVELLRSGFDGLKNVVLDSIAAYEESAKVGRETERVLRTTGAAAWITAGQVSDLASALSDKSGVDDEAIQSGENLILTFTNIRNEAGKGNDIFDQTTQLALDMATALGKDMATSALQLGKALQDPVDGMTKLSRAGVVFTDQQKDQVRQLQASGDLLGAQKVILAEVAKEFGGAAEAAATPLEKLKVKIDNMSEAFGGMLMPAVNTVANFLNNNLVPGAEALGKVLSENGDAIVAVSVALTSTMVPGLVAAAGGLVKMVAIPVGRFLFEAAAQATILMDAWLAAQTAGEGLAVVMEALTLVGPALALAAIAGAAYAVMSAFNASSKAADDFWDSATRDVDMGSIEGFAEVTDKVDERLQSLTRTIGQASFSDYAKSAADLLIPFHDIENSLMDQQKEHDSLATKEQEHAAKLTDATNKLSAYADAQAGVNETNRTSVGFWDLTTSAMSDAELAAIGVNQKLNDIAASKKIDLTEPGAVDRVTALYQATLFTTTSTLNMSEAQKKYNDAASTAKDKVDAYKQSLDALVGIHVSAAVAETNYVDNSWKLVQTLQENQKKVKGVTDASTASTLEQTAAVIANDKAIQDNVRSAMDHSNAVFQETNDLNQATDVLKAHRDQLFNVMIQMGYNETQANAYIDRLGLTPANINTQVNLANQQANTGLDVTKGKMDLVGQGVNGNVTVNTSQADKELDALRKRLDEVFNKLGGSFAAITHSGRSVPVGLAPVTVVPTVGTMAVGAATPAPVTINVNTTGLGASNPDIQRAVVDALKLYTKRNGSLAFAVG